MENISFVTVNEKMMYLITKFLLKEVIYAFVAFSVHRDEIFL